MNEREKKNFDPFTWSLVVVIPELLIHTSLVVRGSRPGKQVQLSEDEIKFLCSRAREIFMSQPILLDLEAPIKICGKET